VTVGHIHTATLWHVFVAMLLSSSSSHHRQILTALTADVCLNTTKSAVVTTKAIQERFILFPFLTQNYTNAID